MNGNLVAFISSMLMGMLTPPRFRTDGKQERQIVEEGDEGFSNHNHFIMQICTSVGG